MRERVRKRCLFAATARLCLQSEPHYNTEAWCTCMHSEVCVCAGVWGCVCVCRCTLSLT